MNQFIFRLKAFSLFILSLLPFKVLYLVSDILFIFLYYIFRYRRKVVAHNLFNSFPEKSIEDRNGIERRFYQYLSDLIVESVKTLTIRPEELKKRFIIKNPEELMRHLNAGRSVIAVSGHYGNWEWGPLAVGLELKQNLYVVYKPLTDKRFDNLINNMRARFGAKMVPMKQTLRKVSELKNQTHVLVLVGDQTPAREESQYFTTFLNQPTAVFLGIEKIAIKTNNPILYFSINRTKRGYYECLIKPLVENPKYTQKFEITDSHIKELEETINLKPDYWLWSHKRWKYSPGNVNLKDD